MRSVAEVVLVLGLSLLGACTDSDEAAVSVSMDFGEDDRSPAFEEHPFPTDLWRGDSFSRVRP